MIRRHLPFLLLFAAACGKGPEADAPMRALPAGTVEYTPAQMAQAKLGFDTVRIASTTIPIALPGTLDTPDPETAHVGSIVSGRIDQVMVLPGDRERLVLQATGTLTGVVDAVSFECHPGGHIDATVRISG